MSVDPNVVVNPVFEPILTIIIANVALCVTMIGTTVALYFHSDRKIDEIRKETAQARLDTQKQINDFNIKLYTILGYKETAKDEATKSISV